MKFRTPISICIFLFWIIIPGSTMALDCKNQKTQTDMKMCASSELDTETTRINKTYNDLRLKLNPAQQQQLKEVQLAWIKFKDLACKLESSGTEGGSVHSSILSACLVAKTKQRNKELEALTNCQEGDLSCLAR